MSNSSRRISDRVLAVILSVLLMVGMMPTSAFAAVPGTHEGVFTFTITDGENPIEGAEVTYTVTTQKDGAEPEVSAEEKVSTGEDGVAEIVNNLPAALESDVAVTVNYTVKATGYTDVTSVHTVTSLTDNVAVTMNAIPTVDVTATVVGKGSIAVGGTAVDAENIVKVQVGTVNTIVVTPGAGYEISSLSIGGTAVVIDDTNKSGYTDTAYQFDVATAIDVTFADVEAPAISLIEAAPNGWTNSDKTVTVTASDNSDSFTVYYYFTADGETAAQEAENGSFTAAKLGNYTVYAVDAANNKSVEQTIDVTQVDKVAPVVDSISGDPSNWAKETTVTGTVSDADSGVSKVVFGTTDAFEAATDAGVTFNAVDATYSFTVTVNGTYYVWAVDAAGNHSEAKSVEITKVDNTDPTISATANPENWTNGIIKVEIVAGDAQSNIAVKYSDIAVGDAAAADAIKEDDKWIFSIEKDTDGTYTYYVWALDEVGHLKSAEVTVYFDGTAPIVAITPLASTDWTNQDVTVTGTIDGVTESATASGLDKVVYGTETDPKNATGVATVEGLNYSFTVTTNGTYNVWSLDKAGNYSDVATITINHIDKVKPEAAVAEDEYAWSKDSVTVSGIVVDADSGIDSVWYNTTDDITGATQVTELSGGNYSFVVSNTADVNTTYYIWVKDAAGNYSDPATTKVKIDITNPTITAEKETTGFGKNRKTVVSGVATDSGSGVKRVVYATVNDITQATSDGVTLNSDGSYEFTVPRNQNFNGTYYIWVEDNVGNVYGITSSGITVDMVAPTIDNLVATPDVWTNGTVVISGSASDASDANYNTSIKEVKYATEDDYSKATSAGVTLNDDGTFSFTISNNAEFNGYYYVWAVDEYGNESASSRITVLIDTTEPTAKIEISNKSWTSLLEALTFGLFSNTQLNVSIEAYDASSPIANSGVAKIEYFKVNEGAENLLTRDALKALDESNWTIGSSLTVSSDEVFVVYVRVTDNAGNIDYFCSDGAILDTVQAGITLTPSAPAADNGNADVYGYYNDDVTVNIKVTDAAPYSGIKTVEYWVTADGVETQRETRFNFTKESPKFNELVSSWEDNIVIEAEKNNSCIVVLNVKVTDNAGNEITESIALDIDVTNPAVSVSYNDNAPANGKYFDGTRTATIQITERSHHFVEPTVYINPEAYPDTDTNCIIIYATDANGDAVTFAPEIVWNPPMVDENNPDNTVYTASILYDADANYTFEIKVMDKATNQNTAVNTGASVAPYEFVVAKVAPTGSVSILTNTWDTLLDALTFGLFSNEKFEVVTSASDKTSPIKIEYYKVTNDYATTPLTWAQLDAVTDWTLVVDNGENEVKDLSVLTVENDEQFVVYLKISNYAGGYTYISTDGAIVDTTNAAIELTPSAPAADNGDSDVYGYYNDDVTVNIKVTDAAPYSGIKTVEYWVTADGVETQRETRFNFTKESPKFNELVSSWEDNIVIEAEKNNSCIVVLNVKVTDNAGNEITESIALDIDVTNPAVSVSYNDNAPANGKYFDGTRTATIQITERGHHFVEPTVYINPETYPEGDTNCIIIYATDADGNPVVDEDGNSLFAPNIEWTPVVDESNPDNTVYTANIPYDVDANYTFEIKVMDKATNQNTTVDTGTSAVPYEFTVDATDPTGSASIGTNVWDKLLEALTFGLYTNEKFDVAASANDKTSPLQIEYYKVSGGNAPTVLKEADLDAVTAWTLLVNNGENTVEDMHTLTVSDDEQFVVYFKITDYAGNYIYICTDGAIVEDTPPVVDEPAPEITIEPEQPINGLYNGDVKVKIEVTDPLLGETFSGLKTVTYRVLNMGEETQSGTLYSFETENPVKGDLLQTWTGEIVVDSKLNNSNDVVIEVSAEDNAGNTATASVAIKIDITAPQIDISYNNNNPDSGSYYNADRTATITITERNFDAKDVVITITNTDNVIPDIPAELLDWKEEIGTGNRDNTTYTATIVYSADGDYTFDIAYTDEAENVCPGANYAANTQNATEFTIDKTNPVIRVAYNNNEAANGNYFNATRTATITIIEHNFDVNRVNFTQTAGRGGVTPNVTWANNGDTHTATISYTADGDYTFDVTMTDMAGNNSGAADFGNSVAGKDFVIDTTFEDMITIGGVESGKAYGYSDDVIPTIDISDINLEKYTVTLVGVQKDTTIDLTKEVNDLLNVGGENVTGSFDIFEVVQDMDGIYTLSVTSQDKAGNQDAEEITFTVNRFGSVYVYDQYLVDLISDGGAYVLSVTDDLIIVEYNADKLVSDSLVIEITCDGKPLENVIYEVTPEINDSVAVGESGWYQYKYTISKDNFASDGVYKISVSTKDATGNTPENNRYEDLGITFRVDSTLAEISSIVGLEEPIINATEQVVKYTVYDTMGIKSIKIYVDGQLVDEITDFSADLNNYSGSFTLTEQSTAQSIRIVVEDMSGNITDTDAETFSSAYEFNKSVTVSTNIFVRWYANKPLFWGSIGGTAVVAGGLWFFLAAKRKKKEEANA